MPDTRSSKKRDAILELVRSTNIHPKAEWIYEQLKPRFPDLSLGTVYRNIKLLTNSGLLNSVGVINGEERFDGEIHFHSHAACTRCGVVMDLPEKTVPSAILPETLPSAALPLTVSDFFLEIHNVVYYGICNACSKEIAALGR